MHDDPRDDVTPEVWDHAVARLGEHLRQREATGQEAVIRQWQPKFSMEHLDQLDQEDFRRFLLFETNTQLSRPVSSGGAGHRQSVKRAASFRRSGLAWRWSIFCTIARQHPGALFAG